MRLSWLYLFLPLFWWRPVLWLACLFICYCIFIFYFKDSYLFLDCKQNGKMILIVRYPSANCNRLFVHRGIGTNPFVFTFSPCTVCAVTRGWSVMMVQECIIVMVYISKKNNNFKLITFYLLLKLHCNKDDAKSIW